MYGTREDDRLDVFEFALAEAVSAKGVHLLEKCPLAILAGVLKLVDGFVNKKLPQNTQKQQLDSLHFDALVVLELLLDVIIAPILVLLLLTQHALMHYATKKMRVRQCV